MVTTASVEKHKWGALTDYYFSFFYESPRSYWASQNSLILNHVKEYTFWTWFGSNRVYTAQHFWTLCHIDRGWKIRRTGRQKKPQERQRTFCARVSLVWAAVWTLSHVHTIQYSSLGLSLLFYWVFFHCPLLGVRGSVSHIQYFRRCCMGLWGRTEKGTEVLRRQRGGHAQCTR